jgi:hypothetical protein
VSKLTKEEQLDLIADSYRMEEGLIRLRDDERLDVGVRNYAMSILADLLAPRSALTPPKEGETT